MKRNARGLLALLLALGLLLSLGVSAAAEESAGVLEHSGEAKPVSAETPADYTEIFLSRDGSDETGDGSRERPFASLTRAAEAAKAAPTRAVYLSVLSSLELKATARLAGKDVTLLGLSDNLVLTRGEDFSPARDEKRGAYNGALIELGILGASGQQSGSLTLQNIILDDAGRHGGSDFLPACTDGSEDNAARVQDAMIAVYDGSKVTLSAGAQLRNFGGLSALHLGSGASLVLEEGSRICDTMTVDAPEALEPVALDEGAVCQIFEGATLGRRGLEQPEEPSEEAPEETPEETPEAAPNALPELPALPEAEGDGSGAIDLGFTGPESLTRIEDSSFLQYPVDYELSFSVSDLVKAAIEAAQKLGGIASCSGTVSIKLDERLTPDLSSVTLESNVFALDGEVSFDEAAHTITVAYTLKEGWEAHLDELTTPVTLPCKTTLPATSFTPSTADKEEFLSSAAAASLTLTTAGGKTQTFTSEEHTARTKMLGVALALLRYDPNGGEGGPGSERISEQSAYPLKKEPAPTHADVDGKKVVFIGWTETPDTNLYAYNSDSAPQTVDTVSVQLLNPNLITTVYAVYGYDEYGADGPDGVADVLQTFVTLTYDPNGGEGGPEPQMKLADSLGGAKFDIAPEEPTREYYTFLGWSNKADDTKAKYKADSDKSAERDILILEDTTLYAVWEQNPSYTLYYDANGGTNAPAAQTAVSKNVNGRYVASMTITGNKPSRSGYSFQGWATSRRGSASFFAGEAVEIADGDVVLYAVWSRSGSGSSANYSGSTNSYTGNPKTGDTAHPAVYGVLAAAALFACAGTLLLLRRRSRQE